MAKVESGSELLARLCQKPSLKNLDPELFPNGIEPKSIIEISGEEGSGKTQYLIHLIANAILPPYLKGVEIRGLGVSVILVDNNYSFSLIRLISVLEARISCAFNNASELSYTGNMEKSEISHQLDDQSLFCGSGDLRCAIDTKDSQNNDPVAELDIESCIEQCLKRLYIVRCSTSAQFIITLHSIETILANKSEIGLLVIDSVSCFIWTDQYNGSETNIAMIANMLHKLVQTYSLVIFATRNPAIFLHRSHKQGSYDQISVKEKFGDHLCKSWDKLIALRIVFSRILSPECLEKGSFFSANVGKNWKKYFTIDEHGLKFETFEFEQRQ